MRNWLSILLVCSACLTLYHKEALAFGVEPSRIELSIAGGKQKGATVTISNLRSPEPLHIRIYAQDIMFLPDGTNDYLPVGSTDWSCSRWIKVVPEELDIPAGGTVNVRVSIAVPEEAKGGYYSMLFFETGGFSPEGLSINFRIGALVDISVLNTEVRQAKIENISFVKPDQFVVDVFNEGNVLVRPGGKIKILDARGKRIKQVSFNSSRVGVLPKTLRKFTVDLEQPLSRGKYTAKAEIDYGTKYLLVGELPIEVE